MPYITKESRQELDDTLITLSNILKQSKAVEGDLNYSISFILNEILLSECNYATLNKLVGSLECCKIEVYRRVAAPYEDKKKAINGDVYSFDFYK